MTSPEVHPAVRELSARLLPEADALAAAMAERIRSEVPVYTDGDLVPHEELLDTCGRNLRYVLANLAGLPGVGDAPRVTGTRRAEQGVPYAVVLQAYRVGGRFIWEVLVERADADVRDTLLRAAADIWAVTDDLSSAVTDAYRTALVDRARRDGQVRAALVGTLLDGEGPDGDLGWETLSTLGLPRTGELAVVSAEALSPGTESLPDVEQALGRRNAGSAWRLDHDHHEGIVSLRAGFGVEQVAELVAGLAAGRVGMSVPFSRPADATEACRQARLAAAASTPGTASVVRFDEQPLSVLLASAPEGAALLLERVIGPVLELPEEDRALLLGTARTWLAAAGSTSTAARQLHVHRNTVRYRMRRLQELTGHDLTRPLDAARLHVALESARILGRG